MIRIGSAVLALGIVLIALPVDTVVLAAIGLVVVGLGCAPGYPAIIHSTPRNFGVENSQAIVGIQMASAYTGSMLAPPLFGLLAQHISIELYPYTLIILLLLFLVMTERVNKICK